MITAHQPGAGQPIEIIGVGAAPNADIIIALVGQQGVDPLPGEPLQADAGGAFATVTKAPPGGYFVEAFEFYPSSAAEVPKPLGATTILVG